VNQTRAVISVGTNSTRLLVVDFGAKRFGIFGDSLTRVMKARSVGTRIGEGLDESRHLNEDAMRRTLDVVQEYGASIGPRTPRPDVIATSALRRADNAQIFAESIRDLTGSELRILDGDEEAGASFRGAVVCLDDVDDVRAGVLDVGGGSTEYATGMHEHADRTASCEVGAVRLTDWFPALSGRDGLVQNGVIEAARNRAGEILQPLKQFDSVQALALVGGSATTALAVSKGHRGSVGEMELTRDSLTGAFNLLCELPVEKRRTVPGMNPQRADILPAGMLIILTALEMLGHARATVSPTDLLFGYLLLQHERELGARFHEERAAG